MASQDDITARAALDFSSGANPGSPDSVYAKNPGTSSLMISSMLASGISSIGGGVSSFIAQRASGDYQASVARMNAKFAEFEGQSSLYRGQLQASQRDIATKETVGRGRAMTGGSGASVNAGSPAATGIAIRGAGNNDMLMIRANAMRTALGYQSEATNYTAQGEMVEASGRFGATASLITGGLRAISGPLQTYALYDRLRAYSGGRY